MPERTFGRRLGVLYRQVRPGGMLIFTAHGLASRPAAGNPEIPESGFWFRPESEQDDLQTAAYGTAISTPEYVIDALYRHLGAAGRVPLGVLVAAPGPVVVAKPDR
jgi:hypothetical protein